MLYILVVGITYCVFDVVASSSQLHDNQYLIDAGCKYDSCGPLCEARRWTGFGTLLQKGACIERTYSQTAVPEKGITRAYCTILSQRIRDIDSKKEELTLDITLTRRWVDPGIKTNFSQEDLQNGGIALEKEQSKTIWHPDIYIYNLSDYKTLDDSIQVKNFFLRPFNESVLVNSEREKRDDSNATVVEYTMEAKVKIYCNFHLSRYPMDSQVCKFRFGGRSMGVDFVLLEDFEAQHNTTSYRTEDFNINVRFIDNEYLNGMTLVGFDINMARILRPYIMEYYLPCMASVLVSHIGFLIPVKSIPGRAALLVTQFLSLINLFIAGMVRIFVI